MISTIAIVIVWIGLISVVAYLLYHSRKIDDMLTDDAITARIALRNKLDLEHVHIFLKDMTTAVKSVQSEGGSKYDELSKLIDTLNSRVEGIDNAHEAIASLQEQIRALTTADEAQARRRQDHRTTIPMTSPNLDNTSTSTNPDQNNTNDPWWSLLIASAGPIIERLVNGLQTPILSQAASSLATTVNTPIESQPPIISSSSILNDEQVRKELKATQQALADVKLMLKARPSSSIPEPPVTPTKLSPPLNQSKSAILDVSNLDITPLNSIVETAASMGNNPSPTDLSNSIGNQLLFFINEDFSGEVEQVPSKSGVTVRVGALEAFRAMYIPDGISVVLYTASIDGLEPQSSDPFTSGTHVIPKMFTTPGSFARIFSDQIN